ncbi:MAG: uroporphyrinogen-III synthase [Alphaproteobacteria bacterium]|nr:uroporphyrinogen-III synthase [Alphaproteobacteria bacterium]
MKTIIDSSMHILITRPQTDAAALGVKLQALGHKTTSCPMLIITPTPQARLPQAQQIAAFAFTSANGVRAFDAQNKNTSYQAKTVYAIGAATAAACAQAGFTDIIESTGGVAQFADMILARPPKGKLIHITGQHQAGNLCHLLIEGGIEAEQIMLYRAQPCQSLPPDLIALIQQGGLQQGGVDGVLFYSSRSADIFCHLAEQAGLTAYLPNMAAICLSPAIAERAARAGFCPIWTAAQPSEASLLALLAV